jgi:hypothetical protein
MQTTPLDKATILVHQQRETKVYLYTYKVMETCNTITPRIKDTLTEKQLEALVKSGINVRVIDVYHQGGR